MTASTLSGADAAERRLARYLRERAADGPVYCKSKFVAEALELTPSQIGHLLSAFEDGHEDLDVEKWAYTNATTWRVTLRE